MEVCGFNIKFLKVLLRTHLNCVRKPVLYVMVLERTVVNCLPLIILSDTNTPEKRPYVYSRVTFKIEHLCASHDSPSSALVCL